MTKLNYKYSLLKYVHTPILNESINIGVLLYCVENKVLYFNYSKNLSRIKNIYNNVAEKTIKEILKFIENRVQYLNNNLDFIYVEELDRFDYFIDKYILTFDSTVVQFSKSEDERVFNIDFNTLIKLFESNYFIDDIKSQTYHNREPELLRKFMERFKNLDLNNNKFFYTNYHIENSTGVTFKFDYAWQNGSLNLVKPLSFDLKDEKNITEKAYKNFGQFSDLSSNLKHKNVRFDLLIARPTSKKMYKTFDHALTLLDKIDLVNIIDENRISEYSQYAIENITK